MSAKRLYKSNKEKMVSGVCGGIAEYFDVDPTIVRLIYAIFLFSSCMTGIIVYIVAAIIIPEAPHN